MESYKYVLSTSLPVTSFSHIFAFISHPLPFLYPTTPLISVSFHLHLLTLTSSTCSTSPFLSAYPSFFLHQLPTLSLPLCSLLLLIILSLAPFLRLPPPPFVFSPFFLHLLLLPFSLLTLLLRVSLGVTLCPKW